MAIQEEISASLGVYTSALGRAQNNLFRLQSIVGYVSVFLSLVGACVSLAGASSHGQSYLACFLTFITLAQLLASIAEVPIVHFLVFANVIFAVGEEGSVFTSFFYNGGNVTYYVGVQMQVVAIVISIGTIHELYQDSLSKILAGARTIFGGIAFAIYVLIAVGLLIAQTQGHTELRFTLPALMVSMYFLLSLFLPIKGLLVVTVSLLARQFVELSLVAALRNNIPVAGGHTMAAGYAIAAAATLCAVLLLVARELLSRGSIDDLVQDAKARVFSLFSVIPIAVSAACFIAALGSYFGVVGAMNSSHSYSDLHSMMLMSAVLATLFHTVGLLFNASMLLYSSFSFLVFTLPYICFTLASTPGNDHGAFYASTVSLSLFLVASVMLCHLNIEKHIEGAQAAFQRAILPHIMVLVACFFMFLGSILLFSGERYVAHATLYISVPTFLTACLLVPLVLCESGDLEYLITMIIGTLLFFTMELALENRSSLLTAGGALAWIGAVIAAFAVPTRHVLVSHEQAEAAGYEQTPGKSEGTTLIYQR